MFNRHRRCVIAGVELICVAGYLGFSHQLWASPPRPGVDRADTSQAVTDTNVPPPVVDNRAVSKVHPTLLRRLEEAGEGERVKAWVLFVDKGIASQQAFRASLRELSTRYNARAIERRRQRRTLPGSFDVHDLPVPDRYVNAVAATGVDLRVISRWVNGVSVMGTTEQFEQIAELPFVKVIQPVRRGHKIYPENLPEEQPDHGASDTGQAAGGTFYGESEEQLAQMNLIGVHDAGFTAAGVIIGILDTGFQRTHEAFNDPTHPVDVIAEYDFVDNDPDTSIEPGDPSGQHSHGTAILGTLGAYKPGQLVGAAYDASFILCKTEDITAEYPAEEDNYVAGLEFIEANGGDVVTSSLGYINWYSQDDLDGLTAVTTIAVNIATGNGVHCCNAAGNSGHDTNPTTSRLIAPSDALEVIACGAVRSTGVIASFSSDGPSADGRVKPELLARGVDTRTVSSYNDTGYTGANGTSLSTPLVAGAVACLAQARPEWTVDQMRSHLFQAADYYVANGTFDPLYIQGYGILNALTTLPLIDCNNNGVHDSVDINMGASSDCNNDGTPDECEMADCPPDDPSCQDCNGNDNLDECDLADNDCNENGIPDDCEVPPIDPTRPDCNDNGIPDDCDLDCQPDGIPDDCECVPVDAPQSESWVAAKNRYLSCQPGSNGCRMALRVTFADLPAEFAEFQGQSLWAGLPEEYCENSGQDLPPQEGCGPAPGLESLTMWAAKLQCEPYYTDWGALGTVHLYHESIIPSGTYIIEALDEGCDRTIEENYSAPLTISTSKWGDVVGDCTTNPCGPPDGIVNVTTDVTAVLDKFRNLEGAPIKARSDIDPNRPDQIINMTDVTHVLDAFRGFDYPFEPGPPPPCP